MCDECDWEGLLSKIDKMLSLRTFNFASNTLEGIKRWVSKNKHCTKPQEDAIENIWVSVE